MKKYVATVMLLLICLYSLCSCGTSNLKLYEAYLVEASELSLKDTDHGDVVYNKASQVYSLPESKTSKKWLVSDKEISIGPENISLQYDRSYRKEFCEYDIHSYENEEYGIRAQYRADDGSLEYLRLGDYKYRLSEDTIQSEQELMEICNEYVLQHVESVDQYEVQIETKLRIMDDNGLRNQIQEGFVSTSDNENVTATYQVDYIYEIDGFMTAESINISIDSEGYLQTASFHMIGAFGKFKNVSIDESRCDELISTVVSKACDVEEYLYVGYSDTKILLILENRLCVLSYVQPKFVTAESEEDLLATIPQIQILVPVAK